MVRALANRIRSSANPLSRGWVDWRLKTELNEIFQKLALEQPPWGLPFCWMVVTVVFSVWAIIRRFRWKLSERPNRFLGHLFVLSSWKGQGHNMLLKAPSTSSEMEAVCRFSTLASRRKLTVSRITPVLLTCVVKPFWWADRAPLCLNDQMMRLIRLSRALRSTGSEQIGQEAFGELMFCAIGLGMNFTILFLKESENFWCLRQRLNNAVISVKTAAASLKMSAASRSCPGTVFSFIERMDWLTSVGVNGESSSVLGSVAICCCHLLSKHLLLRGFVLRSVMRKVCVKELCQCFRLTGGRFPVSLDNLFENGVWFLFEAAHFVNRSLWIRFRDGAKLSERG